MARPKKVVVEEQVVEEQIKQAVNQVDERVTVTLKDKDLKNYGVYVPYGFVEFKDGKANVLPQTQEILKKMGVI